ncbi:MAG: hypothetical protein KVP17_002368 [Porospora cf. gigantea B]|nr:MAG: hypothetical protein KVP17_002368 [Porospora cf. gigantea B]
MVQEVLREFAISFDRKDICKRCAKCNGDEWNVVGPDAVKGMVFECTRQVFDSFWVCKRCSQVYWEGPMYKLATKHFDTYRTGK